MTKTDVPPLPPMQLVGRFEPQSPEWLAARRTGIGASDAPSILGVEGAYLSPIAVWADKIGITEILSAEDREAETERMYWGRILEPSILAVLEARLQVPVIHTTATFRHPDYPFMIANPDGWVLESGEWGVAEAKNVGEYNSPDWREDAPLKFQVQLQHQMAVTGLRFGILAALLGGNRMRHLIMRRNDRFIEAMIPRLAEFWHYVEDREQPPAIARDVDILRKLYEGEEEKIVGLPVEAHRLDRTWAEAKTEIKTWTGVKDGMEVKIRQLMGDATVGVMPGGGAFRIVKVKRGETEYNYLRRVN